jgi:PncC family amidohydrolase
MTQLEASVINALKEKKQVLCTLESCTGGLIAHRLTNIPGASQVFWGSWITYDNSFKEDLGISAQLLSQKGAVSAEVALQMATQGLLKMHQALNRPGSTSALKPNSLIALVTTGIAGPTGGSAEKPVGLCYIAIATTQGASQVDQVQAPRGLDRTQIKQFFAEQALELILKHLK